MFYFLKIFDTHEIKSNTDKDKDNTPIALLRYPPVVSINILLIPIQTPTISSIRSCKSILIFSHSSILIPYYYLEIFEMIILFNGVEI
jgi:hypothetical protein